MVILVCAFCQTDSSISDTEPETGTDPAGIVATSAVTSTEMASTLMPSALASTRRLLLAAAVLILHGTTRVLLAAPQRSDAEREVIAITGQIQRQRLESISSLSPSRVPLRSGAATSSDRSPRRVLRAVIVMQQQVRKRQPRKIPGWISHTRYCVDTVNRELDGGQTDPGLHDHIFASILVV